MRMLIKLNQGEKLDPKALAAEFNVNLRTIQRDIHERFGALQLQKTRGLYHLEPALLGKLMLKDIDRFASLAGVKGLFPGFSQDFLPELLSARGYSALLVKGPHYEDLRGKEQDFGQLESAIVARRKVSFEYLVAKRRKAYEVEPYKLINNKGVWYLAARHNTKLKTFSFSKIERLTLGKGTFTHDPQLDSTLASEDGIWLSEEPINIVLKVDQAAAGYFKRRKLIANQVIDKELADGSLIVSAKVGHPNQVLPIVRYWLPSIEILSPDGLQQELENALRQSTPFSFL